MIKNSNKMYKVLGLLIAVAGSSCLPLAAENANVSVPLINNTNQAFTCTVTQSGSSSAVYDNSSSGGLAAGAGTALSLNNNATYTIAASTVVSGNSVTSSLQFSTTPNYAIYLTIAPNGTSFAIVSTIVGTPTNT